MLGPVTSHSAAARRGRSRWRRRSGPRPRHWSRPPDGGRPRWRRRASRRSRAGRSRGWRPDGPAPAVTSSSASASATARSASVSASIAATQAGEDRRLDLERRFVRRAMRPSSSASSAVVKRMALAMVWRWMKLCRDAAPRAACVPCAGRHLDEIAEHAVVPDLQRLDVGLVDQPRLQRGDHGAGFGRQRPLGVERGVVALAHEAAVAGEQRRLVVDGRGRARRRASAGAVAERCGDAGELGRRHRRAPPSRCASAGRRAMALADGARGRAGRRARAPGGSGRG